MLFVYARDRGERRVREHERMLARVGLRTVYGVWRIAHGVWRML